MHGASNQNNQEVNLKEVFVWKEKVEGDTKYKYHASPEGNRGGVRGVGLGAFMHGLNTNLSGLCPVFLDQSPGDQEHGPKLPWTKYEKDGVMNALKKEKSQAVA